MSLVIETYGLTRRFGDFTAVDHLNFSVESGRVVGFLGPNGSGKTTTIRMLLGLLRPDEGSGSVLGYDIFRRAEQIRAECGYMSQKFALYQDLTVRENMQFYGGLYGLHDQTRIRAVLEELELEAAADLLVHTLSAGWRQRLALGAAIVHRPKLFFLDEPSSGVDPVARRDFWNLIYRLAGEGITILVTTHYMDEAEYCQRVAIMQGGHLLADDSPTNLKQALPGRVWQVAVQPLLPALDLLNRMPDVLRASLDSDCLRVIAQTDLDGEVLNKSLQAAGYQVDWVTQGQPTMEDVFLMLAGRQKAVQGSGMASCDSLIVD